MRIALLPGDGIGPEVIAAARLVLERLVPDAVIESHPIGFGAFEALGKPLPDSTLQAVRAADATLLGAVTTPVGVPNYRSPILELRQSLELFANIRPVLSTPLEHSRSGIDLVIVRENSEGLYAGREVRSSDGETAIAERVVTRSGSRRIARQAYELARSRRGQVTIVHKANVLRETCGLFLEVAQEIGEDYPDVATDSMLVDACAMQLIRSPESFDVILTTNLFGDILSDEAAELVGGLGFARSANLGAEAAVFEPVHGSAPDIAGQGIANPFASLGALSMLLLHLGYGEQARQLDLAIDDSVRSKDSTPDIGGKLSTMESVQGVLGRL